MPSNLQLNEGTAGGKLVTKQITHDGDTAQLQAVSIMGVTGSEDSYTQAEVAASAANGLEVDVTRVQGTVTVGGTVTANLSATDNAVLDAIQAAVEILDNAIAGSEMQVDVVTSALPTGAATAANQSTGNTALAAIQTAVELLDDAISGAEMQVDVVGALPAGTNAIGKLAANSGVDIGDVDVTSVVPGTGATNLGKAIDSAAGGTDTGIAALAIRDDALTTLTPIDGDYVPLRVSSTGALHVTGGGGGTEYSEDAATPATIVGTASLMERDDALASLTPIEGDWAGMRCSAEGALWVQDFNSDAIRAAVEGTLTVDGSGVTQPVSGTVTANLSATDNAVLDTIDAVLDTINAKLVTGTVIGDVNLGATDNAVLDSIVTNTTGLAGTVSGTELQVDVVGALPAGSNLIGDVGISGARTSGGTTLYKNIDVDESEDQIKATAGQVYWIHAMNLTASVLFLKFYNATAASVTVGTTVPDLTFPLATQGDTNGAGFTLSIPNGIAFGTAITIACTTGVADNDSGAPAANACVVNLGYG